MRTTLVAEDAEGSSKDIAQEIDQTGAVETFATGNAVKEALEE